MGLRRRPVFVCARFTTRGRGEVRGAARATHEGCALPAVLQPPPGRRHPHWEFTGWSFPSLRCAGTRAPGKFQGEELQPLGALQGPGVKSKWGEAEFMGRGGVKRAPG